MQSRQLFSGSTYLNSKLGLLLNHGSTVGQMDFITSSMTRTNMNDIGINLGSAR